MQPNMVAHLDLSIKKMSLSQLLFWERRFFALQSGNDQQISIASVQKESFIIKNVKCFKNYILASNIQWLCVLEV